jgi:replication factor C subunit 1
VSIRVYIQKTPLTFCSYNARTHPLPFMKASNVVAPAKMTKEVPDLEEAMEEDDDEAIVEPKEEDDDETDLKKDKYIKQPKIKKPAAAKKAAPKKASKKKAKDDDEDDEDEGSEEDVKPKKAAKPRGRPAGAKGKGKK